MAAGLVERLEIFPKLILTVDEAVRELSAKVEADAPESIPQGMRRLTHENVEAKVADWTCFKNWYQVGSYAG